MFSVECKRKVLPNFQNKTPQNAIQSNREDFRIRELFTNNFGKNDANWVCLHVTNDSFAAMKKISDFIKEDTRE